MEVVPEDHSTNSVRVVCRPDLEEFVGGGGDPRIVSDANLPILVRQQALHANVSIILSRATKGKLTLDQKNKM